MRPPVPVPVTSLSLIPFSASSLRTMGDNRPVPLSSPLLSAAEGGGAAEAGGGAAGAVGGGAAGAVGGGAAGAGGGGAAGAGGGGAAGAGGGVSSGAGAAAGVAGSAAAAAGTSGVEAGAAPSPITASFTPTSTVSPSGTRISFRTPAAGEGTSESTLSVETSNSGSSRSTASPTAFIQRVMVPSVTVSPSCGIITSANVQSPSAQREHGLTECLGQ